MTAVTGPPGWWLASDGNWYPPDLHPDGTAAVEGPGSELPGFVTIPVGQAPPASTPPGLALFPPLSPSVEPPGQGFHAAYGYPSAPPADPFAVVPGYGYPAMQPSTNGLAIASLVLSIMGLGLLGIGSIVGIIFGFVSRGQIQRSNGTQKGAGLGLAGIIVGFATLSFVLLAIAIPTFLGVQKARTDSVVHLIPTPISLGAPIAGGPAAPMLWESKSQPVATTLTAVPGGVEMAIGTTGESEWSGLPVEQGYQSMQLSASVAIIAGDRSNDIGLGCITPTQGDQFVFDVRGSGYWQIILLTNPGASIVDEGNSSAIRGTGSNTLTIACNDGTASPNSTQLAFEINGTPVANDIVPVGSPQWNPTIHLCSCDGSDTGRFLNAGYYASAGPSTTT